MQYNHYTPSTYNAFHYKLKQLEPVKYFIGQMLFYCIYFVLDAPSCTPEFIIIIIIIIIIIVVNHTT